MGRDDASGCSVCRRLWPSQQWSVHTHGIKPGSRGDGTTMPQGTPGTAVLGRQPSLAAATAEATAKEAGVPGESRALNGGEAAPGTVMGNHMPLPGLQHPHKS